MFLSLLFLTTHFLFFIVFILMLAPFAPFLLRLGLLFLFVPIGMLPAPLPRLLLLLLIFMLPYLLSGLGGRLFVLFRHQALPLLMGKLLLLVLVIIVLLAAACDLLVLNFNTHAVEGVFRFLDEVVDFSE